MKWLIVLALLLTPLPASAEGGPVIDPTKNVLDILERETKAQNAAREAESKNQNMAREYEAKINVVEFRRIKELSDLKERFDADIAKIVRANAESASALLASQLVKGLSDLSERMAKQEQFRWESGGKSSGASELWALIVGGLGLLGLFAGTGIAITSLRRRPAA